MPLSREELAVANPDARFRARLVDAFALSQICRLSIKASIFADAEPFGAELVLTDAAEALAAEETPAGLDTAEMRFGAFLAFYWKDLFVDLEETDFTVIASLVHDRIVDRRLALPWLYGRGVDHAYLAKVGILERQLDPTQTVEIFSELPQGVLQFGYFVTGPWGLLRSAEGRLVRPAGFGPMLGCTDPGCDGLHQIGISAEPSPVREADAFFDEAAYEKLGEAASDWPTFIRDLILKKERDYYHDDFNVAQLPLLLGNALSQEELRIVLTSILEHHPAAIREQIPTEGEVAERFRNAPDKISEDLDAAEVLQLLLLARDGTIIEAIETALDDGQLKIPPTELRNAVVGRLSVLTGLYRVRCELGPAGVRATPEAWRPSVAMRLRRLITQIYDGDEGTTQLDWKLRAVPAPSVSDRLDVYLADHPPETVVRELVLESRERVEAAFVHLRWGRLRVPETPDDERALIDRILWKLGADIFYFPTARETLAKRLDALRRVVRELPEPFTESAREAIRGPGTNLFVSLEELLDLSICFATWALLSDHWQEAMRDRFLYTPDKARKFSAALLNNQRLSKSETLTFEASGRNNLFALTQAFVVLARHLAKLRTNPARRYERPSAEFPHFYTHSVGLEQFPFKHIYPLLDLREDAADAIIAGIERIAPLLDRAKVLDVRNRIPHNREPFPTREEIEAACDAIEEATNTLADLGVIPMPYLYEGESSDRYERTKSRLVNDLGSSFELLEPSPLRMADMPESEEPQLIFTTARLPEASEVLRFEYRQESDYLRRWQGFPDVATSASAEHSET